MATPTKKDTFTIYEEHEKRYKHVMKDLEAYDQNKLQNSDKYNVYDKLFFAHMHQIESVIEMMSQYSKTDYYKDSQAFIDFDLADRDNLINLMTDTRSKMISINQTEMNSTKDLPKSQRPLLPYNPDIIAISESLFGPDSKILRHGIVDLDHQIRALNEECRKAINQLSNYMNADNKPIWNRDPQDRQRINNDKKYLTAIKKMADAKLALAVLEKTIKNLPSDVHPQMKLNEKEQAQYEQLETLINARMEDIRRFEEKYHCTIELSPDGYIFNRSYMIGDAECQFEYMQEKMLFDRHLDEKQTELTFESSIKLSIPLKNGLICELSLPIPTAIEDRTLVFNPRELNKTIPQNIHDYVADAQSGYQLGKDLAKTIQDAQKVKNLMEGITAQQVVEVVKNINGEQISQTLEAIDPQTFVETLNGCLKDIKDWTDKVETRIHGQYNGTTVNKQLPWVEALGMLSDVEVLQNYAIRHAAKRGPELTSDWKDDKKNTIKKLNKDLKKDVNKKLFSATIATIKYRIQSKGDIVKAQKEFQNKLKKLTKDFGKKLIKTTQVKQNIKRGYQMPLKYESNLGQHAQTDKAHYQEHVKAEEKKAEYAAHQEGNTRSMQESGMLDDIFKMPPIFIDEKTNQMIYMLPQMSTQSMAIQERDMLPKEYDIVGQFIMQQGQDGPEVITQDTQEIEDLGEYAEYPIDTTPEEYGQDEYDGYTAPGE